MRAPIFIRLLAVFLVIGLLPMGALAVTDTTSGYDIAAQSFQERKQEKKPVVKEVPQSRKQDKPREVKPVGKTGKN